MLIFFTNIDIKTFVSYALSIIQMSWVVKSTYQTYLIEEQRLYIDIQNAYKDKKKKKKFKI